MNTYNYKNISVNVTTINPQWVDHTGETFITLHSKFIAELIENSCTFSEFFVSIEQEELYNELDEDLDAITKHFEELGEAVEVEVRNADAIIAVYEYALDNEDIEFSFNVDTENISWVIHDILHARHDAGGCTIYVESEIERERILESLKITVEQFPNDVPDYIFLENLEEEFKNRFNESLDLEDFKYHYFEDEEE